MFITLYSYRAKPGQAQAIRALYDEWQQRLANWNVVSTELLSNCDDGSEMIILARFGDEEAAWRAAESSDYRAWYTQLVRLAEEGPLVSHYHVQ